MRPSFISIRRLAAVAAAVAVALTAIVTVPADAEGDPPHLLVFTGTYGFRHDGITEAAAVIQNLAREGGFTVEVTDDPAAAFDPATYARIDGVILPNVTGLGGGNSPLSEQQRDDFLAFVAAGGAVIGVHASADSGNGWPAYDEMLGSRGFDSHPHYSLEARDNPAGRNAFNPAVITDVVVQVEDDDHVTTTPWHGFESFRITDEIYRYQENPREIPGLDVVLSLDEESHYWRSEIGLGPSAGGLAPTFDNPASNPFNEIPATQMPDDNPIAWVKPYGAAGAVFYTNLGHNMATWERVDFQEHLFHGIWWALDNAGGGA